MVKLESDHQIDDIQPIIFTDIPDTIFNCLQ